LAEIEVGQIGYRGRGRELAPFWSDVEGARLAAVADMVPEHIEDARTEFPDIAVYGSHAEMLEAERLDIVVIATSPHFRAPIVKDVAASDVRGIYMEKPIANSLAEADVMIEQCRAGNTVLSIGHQRRWTPRVRHVRDAIEDGAIGRPTHGLSYWTAGRIGSNGTHFLDMINFVIGSDPVEVTGTVHHGTDREHTDYNEALEERMAKDPGAIGQVRYANGYRHLIYCMPDVLLPHTHMFCGSRGRIDVFEMDEEDVLYRARDEDTRDMRSRSTLTPRDLGTPPVVAGEAETNGYRELVDCIRTGRPSTSSGEDGLMALEIVVAFHLSSEAGGSPVALPIPTKDRGYEMQLN
jgi:predicted dehydrogenase